MTFKEAKIKVIAHALRATNGNKTKAAKTLNIPLRSLRYYVAKFEELKEFRKPSHFKYLISPQREI